MSTAKSTDNQQVLLLLKELIVSYRLRHFINRVKFAEITGLNYHVVGKVEREELKNAEHLAPLTTAVLRLLDSEPLCFFKSSSL